MTSAKFIELYPCRKGRTRPPDRDHESAVLGVDAGVSEPIPNRACALRHYGWAVSPPCSKLASTRRTRKEIIYTSDSHIKRLPDSSGLRQVRGWCDASSVRPYPTPQ